QGYEFKGWVLKEKEMEKCLKVDGMMCAHCEAHVKEALEKIDGVASAKPDHKLKEVKLTLSHEVEEDQFKEAVTKAGYQYLGLA
ncbi:MAG: heavy-metal-associated domain-containing protein, partial [Desulfovibrionaceae bacterium]|nr:heavy-metal-associated domain-containing protein [Desulfovibrionaceae bacterium]